LTFRLVLAPGAATMVVVVAVLMVPGAVDPTVTVVPFRSA
jgi:hypothetical protein